VKKLKIVCEEAKDSAWFENREVKTRNDEEMGSVRSLMGYEELTHYCQVVVLSRRNGETRTEFSKDDPHFLFICN
jgi:hypothetical protein